MKQNRNLNFFKGIACFLIVFAHIEFPGTLGEIMWNLAHWVVFFFYMISGYYSYYEDKQIALKKIPSKLLHILKITIYAITVYFVFLLLNHMLIDGNTLEWLKGVFSIKTLFDAVVMTKFEFIKASHLWYLPALIYCYVILYGAIKFNKTNICYKLIPITIILRILMPYLPGFEWHYQQNVIVGAFPFFFMGYYYASHKKEITNLLNKFSNRQLIAIIFISLFLRVLDLVFKPTADIFELGAIITAITIFSFSYKNPNMYISKSIETIGVKYSLFIYIMHILIAMIIKTIFEILSLSTYSWYQYIFPIIVPIATLIFAILWSKIIGLVKSKNKLRG